MAVQQTSFIIAPSRSAMAAEIARWIERCRPECECRIFSDPERMRTGLEKLRHRNPIAILLPGSTQELDRMIDLAAWFEDSPLILMIPDRRPKTIAKAHRLRPRYLAGPKIDRAELYAVLSHFFTRHVRTKAARRSVAGGARIISMPFSNPCCCKVWPGFGAKPGPPVPKRSLLCGAADRVTHSITKSTKR